MIDSRKTAIVTGASQRIGGGVVKAFVGRGFNIVANSRKVTQSAEVKASNQGALVDGHIGDAASELLRDVFGEETVSSRLVFSVASPPLGSPVELEVILEVKP